MEPNRSHPRAIHGRAASDPATLVALLQRRAEQRPTAHAYTFLLDGELDARSMTYGELDRRARAIAASLGPHAPAGERALILVPPGLDFIAAFFGCLYAGCIAVPVPLPQRKRGLLRVLAIARDCRPRVVLTTELFLAAVEQLREDPSLAELSALRCLAVDNLPDGLEGGFCPPRVTDATVAFLQYTSGSTGAPKGVVLTHGNLLCNELMIQRAFGHTEESVIVGWLPPHHDMGLIGNILQPLYMGVPCVQLAPEHFLMRPYRWLAAISRYRATTSGGPNFAYELCVSKIPPEQRADLDLRSWKVAFNGAEPVRAATLDRFADAFAPSGFRRDVFYPCYGLAEATLLVTGGAPEAPPVVRAVDRAALEQGRAVFDPLDPLDPLGPRDPEAGLALVGCGRSPAGEQVAIVDPETRAPCADERVGEIWVAGPSVAQGYWERPEDTASTFGARLSTGEGPYLRTGDLGFLSAGELYVTGRLKDLIIVRGRNLYPQDIELTAEQSHPGLRAGGGAAFSVDLDGEERLVVVQELSRRASADLADVAAAVRAAVADRHEVTPHEVVLIKPGSLPRTTSGKVQRKECRARLLDGSLEVVWRSPLDGSAPAGADGSAPAPADDPPQTALETALSAIWAEVLGRARVGRRDEFLSLGGDTLRAMQVSARVSEALSVDVGPAQLFESTTVAALAAWIEARRRGAPETGSAASAAPFAPLAPATRPEHVPLSFVQERLWFLDQLVAGAPVYHVAAAVRFAGALDPRALEQALTAITARHEALRTRFPSVGRQPVQEILPAAPVALHPRDLSDRPERERAALLRAILQDEARRPFDLAEAPPVRWTLVRVSDREHVLALTCHHLTTDGWSMAVLLREIVALYGAFAAGGAPALAPLPLQYADHALWQRAQDGAGAYHNELAYWRERLERPVAPLDLPADRPRPPVQTYAGAREELALRPDLVERLAALGRREGATLFATLAAGLFVLLHRYTGQTDLCVGAPVAARPRVALEGVVGCFINTLALRVDLSGNPRLTDVLARVRAAIAEAQAHQNVPFERVLQALPLARDLGRSPLFQVMFSMQPPLPPTPALPDLAIAAEQLDTGTAQFDLALDVVSDGRDGRGARAAWEYNTDLFDAATIRRLTEHLGVVLESMAARPDARLGELSLLGASDPLLSPGQPERVAAPSACVHALFEAEAARRPTAVALIHGDEQLTYAAVDERASRLAHHLRRLGVGPETRVGVCLDRSADLVVSVLAVLKAGGAYVPLDPTHPPDRLRFQLADAAVAVLITRSAPSERLPATSAAVVCLDRDADVIAASPARLDPAPARSLDHLAYVLYTSGSTGRPKGVMVTHRTLASAFAAWREVYRLPAEELRVLQLANPAFDVWTADWVRALCSGGTLVVAPHEAALDPAALSSLLRRERVTVVDLVPALLKLLLAQWDRDGEGTEGEGTEGEGTEGEGTEGEGTAGEGTGSLRLLIVGSDAWSMRDYARLRARCAPHTRILSCYGVTEATIDSAWFEGAPPAASSPEALVPLGRAFPGTRLHVLDRYGQPLPVGVPGELWIGGAGVARGYWQKPGLTAERFTPDPFSGEPGARLYRTGDRARRLPDGTLEFLGRVDHQVKLRGLRVELTEIEACLRLHPDLRDAAVALKGGPDRDRRLVGYLVPAPDRAPRSDAVRQFLREHLPEVMIPSAFMALDALPLNPNGKVDREALPLPEEQGEVSASAATPPRTELERTIAAVWQEVLLASRIGVEDNFFDLGGHSLLVARVRTRLREQLNREVAMLDLFKHPTIASLAAALSAGPEAEPARRADEDERDRERARAAQRRRGELLARRRGGVESKK
ncbi:amino acid adenylation domain-containing protein [Sorangium sp. So ce131]|uniref:amino acid adenylation domain-containing protein n=1 Tax=Sorangium sp. So ce131 TaxID=3133282 RepID=UPI003F62649B